MTKYSYYKYSSNEIERIEQEISPDKWLDSVDWINIYSNDRIDVLKNLPFTDLTDDVKNLIIKPEDYLLTKTFKNIILQNFIISKKSDINKVDYITVIVAKRITICIFPESENFDLEREEAKHIREQFEKNRIYYSFLLIQKVFTQNMFNISVLKKEVYKVEEEMISSPDKITSSHLMNIFMQIRQIVEVVEEQYIGFKFFYNMMLNKQKEPDSDKLKEVIDSFSELSRMTNRLEEKVESLRTHFMLIHQEASSHKINVLTIIQAIFVPLTFIAGVYGMNFENMPELSWKYAYITIWGVFIFLSATLLYFFKRNGWFD